MGASSSMEPSAMRSMMTEPPSEAFASGRMPNLDTMLWAKEGITEPSGMRTVDVTPAGGIALRVLPDRGLDIGQAWFLGTPLAWLSSNGERPPLDMLEGMAWSEAFGGGLMTTCGLRNVGMPSEGHGLHGTFSHLRARGVEVVKLLEGPGAVRVTGRMVDGGEEPKLTVDRSITSWAGTGRVEVVDVTRNLGTTVADAPLLYHLNFGFPLWFGSASLEIDVIETLTRDEESGRALDRWDRPPPIHDTPEWVLEHRPRPTDGQGRARIVNPQLAMEMAVSWPVDELPMVNQWLDASPGMGVLGIEPANCTTRGRAYERANGTMPTIEPGQQRTTAVTVEARSL